MRFLRAVSILALLVLGFAALVDGAVDDPRRHADLLLAGAVSFGAAGALLTAVLRERRR